MPRSALPTRPHLVAAVAYDGLCTFEFGCVVEVFGLPRPELGVPWYRFEVCGERAAGLRATGGVRVQARRTWAMLEQADTIVIPGWRGLDEPVPPLLLRRLQRAHARGARLASICSGVFVLAAAGLLDGKAATTHWRYAETLQRRHPAIRVRPNALYVDEGQVLTSAGSAAGLDMMLHLVRRDHGAAIANRVAQRLVIPPHRMGDQAQFVPRPVSNDEAGRLARLLDWLRAHPAQTHDLASMAQRAAMSVRTLQRQFRLATGLAPAQWLTRERVALAKDLLETTRQPIAQVAMRAGFGSEETLRHHFRRIAGVSPTQYRAQFLAEQGAATSR